MDAANSHLLSRHSPGALWQLFRARVLDRCADRGTGLPVRPHRGHRYLQCGSGDRAFPIGNSGHRNVELCHWALGQAWPDEMFDLVVLSEVGYYLEPDPARRTIDYAVRHLNPNGSLLAAHRRHPVAEYPATGDEFHALLNDAKGMGRAGRYIDEDVVIDLLRPSGTRSVADQEGLVAPDNPGV